jgi:hypothetical protein
MKRYFKREAESDLGEGVAFIEITDGWPSRQVEIYGDTYRWADEAHREWLADQPFDVLELGEEHEIQAEEFEHVWQDAVTRCPARS